MPTVFWIPPFARRYIAEMCGHAVFKMRPEDFKQSPAAGSADPFSGARTDSSVQTTCIAAVCTCQRENIGRMR